MARGASTVSDRLRAWFEHLRETVEVPDSLRVGLIVAEGVVDLFTTERLAGDFPAEPASDPSGCGGQQVHTLCLDEEPVAVVVVEGATPAGFAASLEEALPWLEIARQRCRQSSQRELESALAEVDSAYTAGLSGWRLDPGTLEGVWGPQVYETLGLPLGSQARFEVYLRATHPDDRDRVQAGLAELYQQRPVYLEHRLVRVDGSIRHVAVSARPVGVNRDGGARYFVGTLQDITEKVRIQEELARSLEVGEGYRRLFEAFTSLACIVDRQGRMELFNPQWERTLGYSREELERTVLWDLIHPDDLERTRAISSRLRAEDGELANFVNRYRRKDGNYRWLDWSGSVAGGTLFGVAVDVTDKHRQEELYQALARNLPGGLVLLFDHDLQVLLAEGAELEQLQAEPASGSSLQLRFPTLYPEVQAACRRALSGEVVRFDLALDARVYAAHVQAVTDLRGDTFAGMLLLHNVTDRRRESLLLQQTQQTARVGGWEYDCHSGQLYWTRETYRILSLEGREFEPDQPAFVQLFPPAARESVARAFGACRERGESFSLDLNLDAAGRHSLWVRYTGKALWVDGKIRKIFGTLQDITRERRMLATLQRIHQRNRTLLKGIPDLMLVVDQHGNFLDYNPSANLPLAAQPEVFLGENVRKVLPELADRVLESIRLCQETGQEQTLEYTLSSLPGVFFEARILAIETDPPNFMLLVRDMTERHRVETELLRSREQALQASRIKSQFLANMSHEIRTPMNGVLGMTELALATELTPEQREYLEASLQSARNLLAVIDDILDISKIEAGRLELEQIPFPVRQVLGESLRSLSLPAHEKGLELIESVQSVVPEVVLGDPVRFRQVVNNLVGNAVKFTETGEVQVSLGYEPDAQRLSLAVADTGPGIPQDRQKDIFEPFTQADGSTTRQFGGTGLGLAICRQLADMMGGELRLESRPGQGSTFTFTAQLPALKAYPSRRAPRGLDHGRILVAEANPGCREHLRQLLTGWGWRALCAQSGAQALKLMTDGLVLAVVDSDLDDLESLLTALGDIPVLATHALGRGNVPQDVKFLTKPVSDSDLYNAILELLGSESVEVNELPGPAQTVPSLSLRILLAEDNGINAKVVTRMLESLGHTVVRVENGHQVLERVGEDFDLILMDVQMPGMDGLETTRRLRTRGVATPVVAVTANAMAGDREVCLAEGMDGYLSKPIQRSRLIEVLSELQVASRTP